jgi:S1-C subfamily serine protease
LTADGRVRRAYIGLGGGSRAVPPPLAARTGRRRAVEVTSIVDGGPAGRAGIRPGDIVLGLDGHPIDTISDLQRLLGAERIGAPLGVEFARGQEIRTATIVPAPLET